MASDLSIHSLLIPDLYTPNTPNTHIYLGAFNSFFVDTYLTRKHQVVAYLPSFQFILC